MKSALEGFYPRFLISAIVDGEEIGIGHVYAVDIPEAIEMAERLHRQTYPTATDFTARFTPRRG